MAQKGLIESKVSKPVKILEEPVHQISIELLSRNGGHQPCGLVQQRFLYLERVRTHFQIKINEHYCVVCASSSLTENDYSYTTAASSVRLDDQIQAILDAGLFASQRRHQGQPIDCQKGLSIVFQDS